MDLILGSQSPRRKEILSFYNLPFRQIPSSFEEKHDASTILDPIKYVNDIALNKALALSTIYPDSIILTADTIVMCQNELMVKPVDENQAFNMLSKLTKSWHSVFTGLCVIKGKRKYCLAEETKVLFHKLTDDQIKKYHQHYYYIDKAGGYAIQQGGSIIVKSINGCYYNIMGLPITSLKDILYMVGIDLWDYLKDN